MGPQLDSCGRPSWSSRGAARTWLQWGRNLIVAEGISDPSECSDICLLQWGRNLIVAEGEVRLAERRAHIASMGPQLDSCGRAGGGSGRGGGVAVASMGPQLDSCGRKDLLSMLKDAGVLQWGRNLIVAEGP